MALENNPQSIHLARFIGKGADPDHGDARVGSIVMALCESEAGYGYARITQIKDTDTVVIVFRDDLDEVPYEVHRDTLTLTDSE